MEKLKGNSEREQYRSRIGMIMTMIAAAVGLGNLWRFPYMCGMFGGGAFVLVYLIVILLIGAPIMMVEWAAGRHYRKGPVGVFKASGIKGGNFFGMLSVGGLFMSLSVYSIVIGWALYYAYMSVTNGFAGVHAGDVFGALLGNFSAQFICTAIIILMVGATILGGIKDGIERVSKYSIPVLFVIMIGLFIRTMMIPGSLEGLVHYFRPDFSKVNSGVLVGAMGQAFFSLCLGGTFMVTLGSYMSDKDSLGKAAIQTIIGDTFAGLLAGMIILPAAFAFNMDLASGPPLTFITLPEIFKLIPGGMVYAALFFLLIVVAAYLSAVAGYEVVIGTMVEEFNFTRKKAVLVICPIQLLFAIPAIMSLNYLLGVDQLFGSTLQPITSLLVLLAFIWVVPRIEVLKEMSKGEKKPFPTWLYNWTRYGVPICIIVVFIVGLKDFLAMIFG